jgi:hypothetical protein
MVGECGCQDLLAGCYGTGWNPKDPVALGRVWPEGHPSSQISSEAITTMAR